MKQFVIYTSNGTITRSGTCPESMLHLQAQVGEFLLEGEGRDDTHYVQDGVICEKLTLNPKVTGSTLSNLPIPCTVRIDGVPYECTDGIAELSFNFPGTYQVILEALHHIPYLVEITV